MNPLEHIDHIHTNIIAMLKEVAAFERKEFHQFSTEAIEYKGRRDLVSYVDIEAEKKLITQCSQIIPGSGFITEESSNEQTHNGYTWIIDPVDGTTNFTHGIPYFSISLALQYEEETIAGYVYHVMQDALFHSIKGKGAMVNDQPISVSKADSKAEALIATGFPYEKIRWRETYWNMLGDILDETHGIRRLGSAALELCYVAAGRLDGYFEFGLNAWDIAAGALILREAGGKATTISDSDDVLFANQIVASNGNIHTELLEIIQRWAPEDMKAV